MKKKIFLFLLPIIAVAWLNSCLKDPPGPTKKDPCPWPDITTEGLNTFGCKINGKEWVPCVDLYGLAATLRPIDCLITESDGSNFLSISVTRSVMDSTYSNVAYDGQIFIGYHTPGAGRFSGKRPLWDELHPGRPWAAQCQPPRYSRDEILEKVRHFMENLSVPQN